MDKVFITDLDHTFLRNDLSVSEFSKDIWNDMSTRYTMGIATARTFKKAQQFLKGLRLNAPMVLLDGSLIVDEDKKIIDAKFISKNIGDEIIDIASSLKLYPFVLALEKEEIESEVFVFPINGNDYQKNLLPRYIKDDNLIQTHSPKAMEKNFKIVFMGEEDELKELHNKLYEIFRDELKYILAPEAYLDCYFLTVLHKDADKSHGLKSLQEKLNIDFEHFSVFGDNFNDIGMFALAGTAIAVANAQDGVKAKADIVLPHTNDEDAVVRYLKSLNI